MADFKTHITGSTLVGIGIGAAGYSYGIPPEPCLLATGLCSVSGILPDLDSDSGVPYRESVAFVSAFVPMLLISRFQSLGWSRETIVLACALLYIGIRFGVAELFRRYTVHRGMWHSIPAAASVGLLAFLITDHQHLQLRVYWTIAAVAGFMTHLILDEIYSVDFRGVRLKKSFGTALKVLVQSRHVAQPVDLRQTNHPGAARLGRSDADEVCGTASSRRRAHCSSSRTDDRPAIRRRHEGLFR